MKNFLIVFLISATLVCTLLVFLIFKNTDTAKIDSVNSDISTTGLIENKAKTSSTDEKIIPQPDETPFKLRNDLTVSVYSQGLGKVRDIKNLPGGGLMVAIMDKGKVVALPDRNMDGTVDEEILVLDGLDNPNSILERCENDQCKLYVAETSVVSYYDFDPITFKATNRQEIIKLPSGDGHYTRTLLRALVAGEEKLMISVGSSCNVCNEEDEWRASILVSNLDGSDVRVFASGLRNSVFMAMHLGTGEVWATENGRDYLGDDLPPDEVNIIRDGGDYGWPICYGGNIHDSDFDKNQYIMDPCARKTPPIIEIQAHSAPLGIAFFGEESWPKDLWYNALVAYHGSWNRSTPTGYKVVRMISDKEGHFLGQEDFITGWINEKGEVIGRPVAILINPGMIYVSDDYAGAIYKFIYNGNNDSDPGETANDDTKMIQVTAPIANQWIRDPQTINGRARGNWFFEASFPIELRDGNGKVLSSGIATAQGDWMTEEYVPFSAEMKIPPSTTELGTMVLKKDNPSGLLEYDDELSVPIRFASLITEGECNVDGDCELPMDYATRSVCPFQAKCADGLCTAYCPEF